MEFFEVIFTIAFVAILIAIDIAYHKRIKEKKSITNSTVQKETVAKSTVQKSLAASICSENKTVSLYRLQEICETRRLADTAASYDEFCSAISKVLSAYSELYDMHYVTVSANYLHRIEAEGVAWTFMLMNPSHPLIERLDKQTKTIVKAAQALDPKDCLLPWSNCYDSYDSKIVNEKLGCSPSIGRYITDYWDVLPLEYDPINKTINLEYVIFKRNNTEDAATELYDAYFACGIKAARDKVQEYLAEKYPTLRAMFPSGVMDCVKREAVLRLDFSQKNIEQLWKEMPHPFFLNNSHDPQHSAELFLEYFMQQGQFRYALWVANLFEDGRIEYYGLNAEGFETERELIFRYREQYSYHDGGGGCSETLGIRTLSEDKERYSIPEELQSGGFRIPPCRGYWKEGNTVYCVEPFEMDGVFELITESQGWDLED